MAETTHISWCDHTFNGWIGCTKVSVGEKGACEHCYAENLMDTRYGRVIWGIAGQRATYQRTAPSNWKQPLKWDREAAAALEHWRTNPFAREEMPPPSRFVFCSSLADVFDNQVPVEWRRDLFELIRATPHLTWLLLTKRPQNIVKLFSATVPFAESHPPIPEAYWPRNAAIGCTVVTQAEADRDIPHLLLAQAALRPAFTFLSMEPLMEVVEIGWALSPNRIEVGAGVLRRGHFDPGLEKPMRISWAICGGETDQGKHKARETPDGAFEGLMGQCAVAGVPFHLKQMTKKRPVPAHLQIQERPHVA